MATMTTVTRLKGVTGQKLGQMLVKEGLITAEQLENALGLQRRIGSKLGEILVKQGVVKADDLAAVLSEHFKVPLADLKTCVVQPSALKSVPEDMARKHRLLPLDVVGDTLVVVMAYPDDIRAIDDIRARTGLRVEIALGIPSDIEQAIDLNYRSSGEIEKTISQFASATDKKTDDALTLTAQTPLAQTLELVIQQAVRDRASDIHLEPHPDKLRVRYRLDGILHDVLSLPLSAHIPLVSRVKILADMNIAEQRRPQDGQFSIKVGEKDVDIRTATMATAYGERVTLRILDKSLSLFNLSELGFSPKTLEGYRTTLKSPFGMVLVGGPTGSGKTTTLYASVDQLNRTELNIITIEDPVEYRFANISQTQVNPKAGITFASGLRTILRHDPDVILVGEIRDKDTAVTAVQASLTGHLVLASIHANDAVSVLTRMIDLGVERYLIASTLVATVAQRMVRRICPHCRIPYKPSVEEQSAWEDEMKGETATFYQGKGCNLCAHTGYRGRTGLFELLLVTEQIRGMSLAGVSTADIRTEAIRQGMITMKHDGMLKVKEGITSVREVLRSVFSIG